MTQRVSLAGVCLCDGAGSASHSQFGARCAADTASEFLAAEFGRLCEQPGSAASEVLAAVSRGLEREAERLQVPQKQLACTLSFAFACANRKTVRYLCGSLGDGLIVMRAGQQLSVLLAPDNREFANQTWFTTSPDAAARFRIVSGTLPVARIPGWLVTSDGAAHLLHSRRTGNFAPAVMSLLEDLRTRKPDKLQGLLDTLLRDVLAPLAHDDCSIGILQTIARGRNIRRAPH